MALISCPVATLYTTFSAFVTLHATVNQYLCNHAWYSSLARVTWKNEQYLRKACASGAQRENNDKHINNATAQRAVQIKEGTENNFPVAYKWELCWCKSLHARDRGQQKTWRNGEDNKMRTGKRGGNTSERQLHELIIKTTCLHVCNPVFLWLWRPSLWNERLCFLFCGPKGKAGVKSENDQKLRRNIKCS